MVSRLDSLKTNPLIVAKRIKSRFFKYLTFLSRASSSISDDTCLPVFLKIFMYSALLFLNLLSFNYLYIKFNKVYRIFF